MTTKIESILREDLHDEEAEFIPLIADGEDSFDLQEGEGDDMPIVTLRNIVMFPGVVVPVALGRKKSLAAIRHAYKNRSVIGAFSQKDSNVEDPAIEDLNTVGSVAQVIKILELPDGSTTAILQGKKRVELLEITETTPFLHGKVSVKEDVKPSEEESKEFDALLSSLKDTAAQIVKGASGSMPPEAMFAIKNIENSGVLINFICANFGLKQADKQRLLQIDSVMGRGYALLEILNKELQMLTIKLEIQAKTQADIDQQQREYFLNQQIKTIQEELGTEGSDAQSLREKAAGKKWDKKVEEIFLKEVEKLERTSTHSPDYNVQLNYVETILSLPWNVYSKDSHNLKTAQKVLDKEHFGMEEVKDRIIEHLAVIKLKKDKKAPILCLYGPPGVGKTSLGKSVAEALKRKYVRISLGGLHDESEIRGHRRTYIGSMPGRIIQSLQKAETSNPVFILDEIDKVGSDFKGDPSSALLEVLDPEQNNTFHDNFLDIDYDLSNVMFIATANNISNIPKPLLDRMELIEISGYLLEEKVEIGKRHLYPRALEKHGLEEVGLKLSNDTYKAIIERYTRESGVRELDKQIGKLLRKIARRIALNEDFDHEITPDNLADYLGTERFSNDEYQGNDYAGVVTGLAWTSVGGEILFIESSLSKSKSPKLTLTGNLGDVMKESAVLALEYLRANADKYGIPSEKFEECSVHIHVPEGAVPKDGPSAGITMLTSLASSFTRRKVKANLAMTGEITLRGKVLPVGGIKEKILAAKRAGIKEIVLCADNKKDIDDIKPVYIEGLSFHYVKDMKEVLDIALLDELVD